MPSLSPSPSFSLTHNPVLTLSKVHWKSEVAEDALLAEHIADFVHEYRERAERLHVRFVNITVPTDAPRT